MLRYILAYFPFHYFAFSASLSSDSTDFELLSRLSGDCDLCVCDLVGLTFWIGGTVLVQRSNQYAIGGAIRGAL